MHPVSAYRPPGLQTNQHPLVRDVPDCTFRHPLFSWVVDEALDDYLFWRSGVCRLQGNADLHEKGEADAILQQFGSVSRSPASRGFVDIWLNQETDARVNQAHACIPQAAQVPMTLFELKEWLIESLTGVELETGPSQALGVACVEEGMWNDAETQAVLNWLSLLYLYFSYKDIVLEPFQGLMVMHIIAFSAAARAPDFIHTLQRIIRRFFMAGGYSGRVYSECRTSNICVALVPRRMGKTYITQVTLAAGMRATDMRFAYFSCSHDLSRKVKGDTVQHVKAMQLILDHLDTRGKLRFRTAINQQNPMYEPKLAIHFENGLHTEMFFLSLGNQKVGIEDYIGNAHTHTHTHTRILYKPSATLHTITFNDTIIRVHHHCRLWRRVPLSQSEIICVRFQPVAPDFTTGAHVQDVFVVKFF